MFILLICTNQRHFSVFHFFICKTISSINHFRMYGMIFSPKPTCTCNYIFNFICQFVDYNFLIYFCNFQIESKWGWKYKCKCYTLIYFKINLHCLFCLNSSGGHMFQYHHKPIWTPRNPQGDKLWPLLECDTQWTKQQVKQVMNQVQAP